MNDKTAPTKFKSIREAAEAIADSFIGENLSGAYAERWRDEYVPKLELALLVDGHLPNDYEVEALNGCVPVDEDDEDGDYGCPEEVSKKFPNVDRLIASQF